MFLVVRASSERKIKKIGVFEALESARKCMEADFRREYRDTFGEEYDPGAETYEYGISGSHAYFSCTHLDIDWEILSTDQTFYYTFGSDYGFPFQDGWVEIIASNREEADEIFVRHFPCRHPNTLNCSFVYTEAEWLEMDPARNWHGYKRYGTYTG